MHPRGFGEVLGSPGAQLAHYRRWKSTHCSYCGPESIHLSFTPGFGEMTYAPCCTEVRGLKGRDVRAGNSSVLFSQCLFLKDKPMFSMRQGMEGVGNKQGNRPSPGL